MVQQNKEAFADKKLRGELLYSMDKATSFWQHLDQHADFYRRQRMLENMTKYPSDPAKQVSEHHFSRFWMSKLDYRSKEFRKLPVGHSLQLVTLIKIAEAVIITDRLSLCAHGKGS